MLDCCYLKCYVSHQRYHLSIWFLVKFAVLHWVWTVWLTDGESACLFQKFLLLINPQLFKGLFHWLLTARTSKIVTIYICKMISAIEIKICFHGVHIMFTIQITHHICIMLIGIRGTNIWISVWWNYFLICFNANLIA